MNHGLRNIQHPWGGYYRVGARLGLRRSVGAVDFMLEENDYVNPWQATRVVAGRFDLMLQEANGELNSHAGVETCAPKV